MNAKFVLSTILAVVFCGSLGANIYCIIGLKEAQEMNRSYAVVFNALIEEQNKKIQNISGESLEDAKKIVYGMYSMAETFDKKTQEFDQWVAHAAEKINLLIKTHDDNVRINNEFKDDAIAMLNDHQKTLENHAKALNIILKSKY